MPSIEVPLPAGIGDAVQIQVGELRGELATVLAWCIRRPRFLLGGALDGDPQASLLVGTDWGEKLWLQTAEVSGIGSPALATFLLPFVGGDAVVVEPARSLGQVVGWEAINDGDGILVIYRVRLTGTLPDEDIEVEARDLEFRPGF